MASKKDSTSPHRIYFLDNLRTFAIFLVVLVHAGGVYESSGIWGFFWIVDDPATNDLSGIVNLVVDVFVMSIIFFISGYLTPASIRKKTGWEFLRSKFSRLIVPWVVAALTLIPLYKVIFLYSRNLPQQDWTTYFHWSNGIWSQNWLWFLPVLFLFDVLSLVLSKVNLTLPNMTMKKAVPAVFLIGLAYSLCMEMFGWQGWTKTAFLDFQNERLLIYFMIFLLGVLSYKLDVFKSPATGKRLYLLLSVTAWFPVTLYVFFVIFSILNPGHTLFSATIDRLLKWTSFHLTLLSMLYIVINTFRYYLNRQGRMLKELNRNSYNVYIIHTVVIGGIALLLLQTSIPSLLKYFILTVSTYIVSNLLISLYRKVVTSTGLFGHEKIRKTRLSFSNPEL